MTQDNISGASIAQDAPTGSLFDEMGGEAGIRALVDRFYDLMDLEPDLQALRATHGPSLDQARDRLFWFLCGYTGGPNHYIERFGHPRLRARHLPFSIGRAERDQWVVCMGRAMQDQGFPEPLMDKMLESFYGIADWMRNREGKS
ncbi:group II truncated hemoglobin [Corticimicrobacter populi]|uniref:Hemoglobin-like protein n=1 Tax=Corticimicrobacter populi TaxID=2175229 RepID=A0A2V1K817_9BURK|nr:group II truncated hemoglobin [Corticimicrobacter populi]PWF25615.1 hemoglobin-like protein [Corticimicrobacter populi]QDQ87358.1 group II truncated hemoglobin [Alcaligenaceae bacterium SJ-26]